MYCRVEKIQGKFVIIANALGKFKKGVIYAFVIVDKKVPGKFIIVT